MRTARAQLARYPGVLVLLAALVLGQVLQRLAQPHLTDPNVIEGLPLVPTVTLVASVALGLIVLWFRVRLGNQLMVAARQRALSLPEPASLPKKYAVSDPAAQIIGGGLGLLDLVLLLLVQNTLRGPILVLTDNFLIRRTTAESAFVAVVVVIAVLMLIKLWRIGAPVLVLLLWWGLDRVVPTAGFLGSRAAVVAVPTRVARPLSAPQVEAPRPLEATIAAATSGHEEATVAAMTSGDGEATVAAPTSRPEEATVAATPDLEATVLAEATVVTTRGTTDDEGTVLRPETADSA